MTFREKARSSARGSGLDLRTRAGKAFVRRSIASQSGRRKARLRAAREPRVRKKAPKVSPAMKRAVVRSVENWAPEDSNFAKTFDIAGSTIAIDRVRDVAIVETPGPASAFSLSVELPKGWERFSSKKWNEIDDMEVEEDGGYKETT